MRRIRGWKKKAWLFCWKRSPVDQHEISRMWVLGWSIDSASASSVSYIRRTNNSDSSRWRATLWKCCCVCRYCYCCCCCCDCDCCYVCMYVSNAHSQLFSAVFFLVGNIDGRGWHHVVRLHKARAQQYNKTAKSKLKIRELRAIIHVKLTLLNNVYCTEKITIIQIHGACKLRKAIATTFCFSYRY